MGLTVLYWRIGKRLSVELLRSERAAYSEQIVATLWRQSGWSHLRELLPLNQPFQREFYAEMCRIEDWSVRTLQQRIDAITIARAQIEVRPREEVKNSG